MTSLDEIIFSLTVRKTFKLVFQTTAVTELALSLELVNRLRRHLAGESPLGPPTTHVVVSRRPELLAPGATPTQMTQDVKNDVGIIYDYEAPEQ